MSLGKILQAICKENGIKVTYTDKKKCATYSKKGVNALPQPMRTFTMSRMVKGKRVNLVFGIFISKGFKPPTVSAWLGRFEYECRYCIRECMPALSILQEGVFLAPVLEEAFSRTVQLLDFLGEDLFLRLINDGVSEDMEFDEDGGLYADLADCLSNYYYESGERITG